MSKRREQLTILLLQMRGDKSKQHEIDCILKYGKLSPQQVISHDVLKTPVTNDILGKVDGLIIGGANKYRVSHGQPEALPSIFGLTRYAAEHVVPTLGLCFGAHVIGAALGGKTEFHPERKEVSTAQMYLLPGAADDLLFSDMPSTFPANCGRTDDVVKLPPKAVALVRSDLVNYHAFKIKDKPIYATQFHAELGKKEEWERMDFAFAFNGYFKDEADLQAHKDGVQDTPVATSLIEKFIDRLVLPNAQ